MPKRDLYTGIAYFQACDTYLQTTNVTGYDCDLRGYDAATLVVTVGRCSHVSTASYWKLRMQHTDASALGAGPSDYADVASADIIGPSGAITSGIWKKLYTDIVGSVSVQGSQIYAVGYKGGKRYVRFMLEIYSVPSYVDLGAVWLLGQADSWPATADGYDINSGN